MDLLNIRFNILSLSLTYIIDKTSCRCKNNSMKLVFFLLFVIFSFNSCSLKYDDEETISESSPEFTFTGLEMNRIEDKKLTATLTAAKLEQYRDEDAMYAKNVIFNLLDDNNKILVTGSCGLLEANSETEQYYLYDNVEVNSYEQNLAVKAENIKWDNKTEQLVCGESDTVIISTNENETSDEYVQPKNKSSTRLQISGTGFSASGTTLSYGFANPIEGMILTDIVENSLTEQKPLTEEEILQEALEDIEILSSKGGIN